jgi:hypothetical protein
MVKQCRLDCCSALCHGLRDPLDLLHIALDAVDMASQLLGECCKILVLLEALVSLVDNEYTSVKPNLLKIMEHRVLQRQVQPHPVDRPLL